MEEQNYSKASLFYFIYTDCEMDMDEPASG